MALYRYFKASDTKLPDPQSPLSKEVPSTAIAAANGEVKHVVELQRGKTRGPYTKFTSERKAEIGKRAAEHGVVATVRYYEKQFPGKLAPAVSANGRGQLESPIREIYFCENLQTAYLRKFCPSKIWRYMVDEYVWFNPI